jgi:hypothetical protein
VAHAAREAAGQLHAVNDGAHGVGQPPRGALLELLHAIAGMLDGGLQVAQVPLLGIASVAHVVLELRFPRRSPIAVRRARLRFPRRTSRYVPRVPRASRRGRKGLHSGRGRGRTRSKRARKAGTRRVAAAAEPAATRSRRAARRTQQELAIGVGRHARWIDTGTGRARARHRRAQHPKERVVHAAGRGVVGNQGRRRVAAQPLDEGAELRRDDGHARAHGDRERIRVALGHLREEEERVRPREGDELGELRVLVRSVDHHRQVVALERRLRCPITWNRSAGRARRPSRAQASKRSIPLIAESPPRMAILCSCGTSARNSGWGNHVGLHVGVIALHAAPPCPARGR